MGRELSHPPPFTCLRAPVEDLIRSMPSGNTHHLNVVHSSESIVCGKCFNLHPYCGNTETHLQAISYNIISPCYHNHRELKPNIKGWLLLSPLRYHHASYSRFPLREFSAGDFDTNYCFSMQNNSMKLWILCTFITQRSRIFYNYSTNVISLFSFVERFKRMFLSPPSQLTFYNESGFNANEILAHVLILGDLKISYTFIKNIHFL